MNIFCKTHPSYKRNEGEMIMKTLKVMGAIALLGSAMMFSSAALARGNGNSGHPEVQVYVTSLGLYFDSIVLTDLPQKGRFQELYMSENGLTTEFGPGEVGHLGGRWWLDKNSNGRMDSDDMYFLCPLLGPGRENP